ncbi:ABC transporter substrate-binding protein [Natronolimnohabitans innermongolicus]|uniref:ABC transporter substrate-binding protein n=1 Tax=Natronolimnohabitans innermongolicus TaxID=253107 RepID=UPI001268D988|nr:ABC transporter substrate-binding protein [Natronolimnohabitans innermongolicus]
MGHDKSNHLRRLDRRSVLRSVAGAGIAGVTASLAGCLGGEDEDVITKGTTEGGTTGLLTETLMDEGFDEDHGIQIQSEAFAAPPQVQQQLVLNEDIPAAYMGSIVATRNWEDNQIELVGPYMNYHAYIVTREDSDIEEPQDLEGMELSWASREADAWLKVAVILAQEYGLEPDDYELSEVAPATSIGLLEDEDLDAILLHEPLITNALVEHDFEIVLDPEETWEEMTGLPMTTVDVAWEQSWYESNEEDAEAFAAAVYDTQNYIEDNFDDVIDTYADAIGLEGDEQIELAKERLPGTYPTEWSDDLAESGLEFVEQAHDLGILEVEPTDDIYNVIDV